jgi:hypothetical protein
MFPMYMLNRVYVQKSLKNTESGYEFTLKNVIESGTLGGLKSLSLDGATVPLDTITLRTALGEKRADEISPRNYVPLRFNAEAAIAVTGQPLAAGQHEIKLTIVVLEAGALELKIEDEI